MTIETEMNCTFKDGKVIFDGDNLLWSVWTKDDLDKENILTDEQYIEFVRRCNLGFNELCSEYAQDMFDNYFREELEID